MSEEQVPESVPTIDAAQDIPVSVDVPEEQPSGHSSSIDQYGSFADALRDTIDKFRPSMSLETGTFDGSGSTTVLAEAIQKLGNPSARLMTIEADPEIYRKAISTLERFWPVAHCRLGLSVPKSLLPDEARISDMIGAVPDWCAVDWPNLSTEERAKMYFGETDKSGYLDGLIKRIIEFEIGTPDFVLLDSAGHVGTIEFEYLMRFMHSKNFILALDDTRHMKHYMTMQIIESDNRWKIISSGPERFGWAIAEYKP
jgi:hypothetical protein